LLPSRSASVRGPAQQTRAPPKYSRASFAHRGFARRLVESKRAPMPRLLSRRPRSRQEVAQAAARAATPGGLERFPRTICGEILLLGIRRGRRDRASRGGGVRVRGLFSKSGLSGCGSKTDRFSSLASLASADRSDETGSILRSQLPRDLPPVAEWRPAPTQRSRRPSAAADTTAAVGPPSPLSAKGRSSRAIASARARPPIPRGKSGGGEARGALPKRQKRRRRTRRRWLDEEGEDAFFVHATVVLVHRL
jgi:hypothetical protein